MKDRPEGATFAELLNTTHFIFEDSKRRKILIQHFPRKTLDRLLKKLIRKKMVQKSVEPRITGKRGRPAHRYRVNSRILIVEGEEQSIGLGLTMQSYSYGITFPNKKVAGMPFRGIEVKRYGRSFVRLLPSEKERKDRFEARLKEHEEMVNHARKVTDCLQFLNEHARLIFENNKPINSALNLNTQSSSSKDTNSKVKPKLK
jgi:hypothetical protein